MLVVTLHIWNVRIPNPKWNITKTNKNYENILNGAKRHLERDQTEPPNHGSEGRGYRGFSIKIYKSGNYIFLIIHPYCIVDSTKNQRVWSSQTK